MKLKFCLFLSFFVLLSDVASSIQVTVTDETKPSAVNEKFPLLRIVTAFISDNLNLRITTLGNFGSSSFLTRFDGSKTVLFIHAWLESIVQFDNGAATIGIKNAFEEIYSGNYEGTKHNLITVNWTAYNKADYLTAISSLQPIANEIGDQLYSMATNSNNAIDLSKWQFLGYSLGAHIAGLISRRIKERSNGRLIVPRITALDPSGPILNYPLLSYLFPHLEKRDAKFVDAIHTSSRGFGTSWSIGHIDFWPNFGNNQPGCPRNSDLDILIHTINFCSHYLAIQLYANQLRLDSVDSSAYPAVRCTKNFINQLICTTDKTFMGSRADPAAPQGDYYLLTDNFHNLGDAGIAPFFGKRVVAESSFSFQ